MVGSTTILFRTTIIITTNDRFYNEDFSDGDIGNADNGTGNYILGASYETVDLLVFDCESTLWYLRYN
jgi:hypothetical protein